MTGTYAPLPQAPTAAAPSGATTDGAARNAWQPNVPTWIAAWRALITLELAVALIAGLTGGTAAVRALVGAAVLCVVGPVLLHVVRGTGRARRAVLIVDLAACIGLLVVAPDATALAILAAYACSTVISWAAQRPVDAFIAGGACATAYVVLATTFVDGASEQSGFTGTIGLFFFFALATSGFFTVAHRIGALEIATEISRERGRYRRDLHDRLGQALSGLHFEVQAVHAVGLDADAPARMRSLADGYRDAQRMLRDLLSVGDEPMVGTNVASVIKQEARRMGQQAGVRVDVETSGDPSRVPAWMRPHVVAVAGECVNNAVKNGRAAGIDISIDVTEDLVVLSVTDDGVGFDNPPGTITEKEGHYGLREMAERARICGGEVVVASQPGFGTRVRLQAPLPDDAAQDILERDASKLRENVWTLVMALRGGLGLVAALELGVAAARSSGATATASLVLCCAILLDIAITSVASRRLRGRLHRHPIEFAWYLAWSGALFAIAIWYDAPPAVLLYAPLAMLAAAVAAGRRAAQRTSSAFLLLTAGICAAAWSAGKLDDAELEGVLVLITDIALVGMSAIQGAKLLDRLETLQIRVRYQALARLRHGLSGRMRDQLTERLEELETLARTLSEGSPDAIAFEEATARMQRDSTELKQRLRDIVHTLADPTPAGRTPLHV